MDVQGALEATGFTQSKEELQASFQHVNKELTTVANDETRKKNIKKVVVTFTDQYGTEGALALVAVLTNLVSQGTLEAAILHSATLVHQAEGL